MIVCLFATTTTNPPQPNPTPRISAATTPFATFGDAFACTDPFSNTKQNTKYEIHHSNKIRVRKPKHQHTHTIHSRSEATKSDNGRGRGPCIRLEPGGTAQAEATKGISTRLTHTYSLSLSQFTLAKTLDDLELYSALLVPPPLNMITIHNINIKFRPDF